MSIVITKKFPWAWIDKLDIEAVFSDNANVKNSGLKTLKIGILNLMPNVQETELQLANVLSNDEYYVDLHFFHILSRKSSHISPQHFVKFYENWTTFDLSTLDGFIVTGAPLEQVAYKDVTYFKEFTNIVKKLNSLDMYTLYVCWSAQAAAYYLHKIKPVELPYKLSGVYEQNIVNVGDNFHSLLLDNLTEPILCCVSRHTTLQDDDCSGKLKFLLHSDVCGVGVAADCLYSNITYSFNHIEYGKYVLNNEYVRDLSLGRKDIKPPCNYFVNDDIEKAEVKYSWKETQTRFFLNWLRSASNWNNCEYT